MQNWSQCAYKLLFICRVSPFFFFYYFLYINKIVAIFWSKIQNDLRIKINKHSSCIDALHIYTNCSIDQINSDAMCVMCMRVFSFPTARPHSRTHWKRAIWLNHWFFFSFHFTLLLIFCFFFCCCCIALVLIHTYHLYLYRFIERQHSKYTNFMLFFFHSLVEWMWWRWNDMALNICK